VVSTLALIAALQGFDVREFERARVVAAAEAALANEPRAITSAVNPRSAGGPHDFSSEGDYWWPDPANLDGPYVRRDGLTNPGNFTAHRELMFGMARDVGALAAAWDLSRDERFAAVAVRHLRVWFADEATRMNPDLRFAQSIKGVTDGRGIGIIDTLHLAEVALAVEALRGSAALDAATDGAITGWFREYLHWIRTHPNGIEESLAKNNHGTCWVLQAAAFARLAGDTEALAMCRARFIDDLLPNQMAADGSFPLEMARTKPYGYAIFNLDVMTALATVLSTPEDNLLAFALPDGRGPARGVEFLAPFLADKSKWPLPPDVMYWDDWPIRQPALLFGAIGAGRKDWLELWKSLPADSRVAEVQRNFPVRYPTLWLGHLQRGSAKAASAREVLNFNPDWRFTKSDPAGAQAVGFDDAAWERVSTPHTFNDTDTFDNWSLPGHKGEQEQWSGRTWYRKHFEAPAHWAGRRVFIEFESVRQIAEVYLNGERLGAHKSGFTPFGFDLTPHLRPGAANVLAVMVDNRFQKDPSDYSPAGTGATGGKTKTLAQIVAEHNEAIPESIDDLAADQIPWNNPHWHPAHGGIYRDVRLVVTDPLHITLPLYSFLETAGPYAYSLELTEKSAKVGVDIPVRNSRAAAASFMVSAELIDADGNSVWTSSVEASLAAGASETFNICPVVFANPRLWQPDHPHVYRVIIKIADGERVVDSTEIPLGLRHARWDPAAGLFLNGRHLKLHGWGQKSTNEWPGLGAAQPAWLHEFTLAMMRDAGGNIVRWGHTAGSPVQIAAGDRLGLIAIQPGVDGEGDTVRSAWQLRSEAFRDVVIYFRNNPSILIWEGGNQKLPREKTAEMRGHMDRWDPHGGRAYAHRRADQVTAEFMDVGIGTEGGREIARLAVVEGEYNREESPRRVWDDASPPNFGYPEAKGQTYQLTSEQFAANQVAHYVKKLGAPEHAGGANWIFSDSTSGGRVAVEVARASGEVDGVRLPKEAYHAVATMFRDEPSVHIIGHWTYPAGTRKDVFVVSNAEEVELFVNGRALGSGAVSDKYLFTFRDVTWEPGEIRAIARSGGAAVAEQAKRTTGPAVALRITPIVGPGGFVADGSDVALFDVEAVDADGARVPTFQAHVDFELEGPAVWRGGYNSGKLDSINHSWLDLEAGVNRVAVRATREPGTVTLRARSEGLVAGERKVELHVFVAVGGMSKAMAAIRPVRLSAEPPAKAAFSSAAKTSAVADSAAPMAGRFTRTFNYSGPSSYIVHVEAFARAGKNAYVDVDSPLGELPPELAGADWVQAANREAFYHAVDLMELGVAEGAKVFVAHDEAVARPPWLTAQFQATETSITVLGRRMTLFTRATTGGSLTLGPNTEDSAARAGNMYLVFVAGVPR